MLGRNPELSIAEILSYLEKQGMEVINVLEKGNSLIVSIANKLDTKKVIEELGGTIALGEVLIKGSKPEIFKFLDKNEIYFEEPLKFDYSVLDFVDEEVFDDILQKIKDKFRAEKLKAFYRSSIGSLGLQEKGRVLGSPSKLKSRDQVYFISKISKDIFFGRITSVYDPNESEARDMNKPIRREALAISPRLAKILINLSQVKENQTLLDPFCGVGTIMQEALLQNINAIGVDFDRDAINGAKKNLNWFYSNYKINAQSKVINDDSRKVRINNFDGVATEPSLGKLMKVVPTESDANETINGFENLLIDVLNNIKSSLVSGKKIAFTAPLIKTHSKKMGCDFQRICEETGLIPSSLKSKIKISFPIAEMRPDSIVGREFFILEKR
jgi:tRNA G10  N-methylase Trm11